MSANIVGVRECAARRKPGLEERDRTVVGARIVPLEKGAEPAGNTVRSTGL